MNCADSVAALFTDCNDDVDLCGVVNCPAVLKTRPSTVS